MSSTGFRRLSDLLAEAARFGNCRSCKYLEAGPAAICFACARRDFDPLDTERCAVCDGRIPVASGACGNPICGWSDRGFEWNRSIAKKTRQLENAIKRYKYEGKTGWAVIFGRVLAGFLDQHRGDFEPFDLVVASPAFVGGERTYHHTRDVIKVTAQESLLGAEKFDVEGEPAVALTSPVKRMVDCRSWRERFDNARGPLREALRVDRSRVGGKDVLVYDDVFTGGHTLDEVARALRRAGARRVCGVSLARQPFRVRS